MFRATARAALVAVIAFDALSVAGAQTAAPQSGSRPNFTGRWSLDLQRSQFGEMPAHARTDSIEHSGERIVVLRTLNGPQGEISGRLTYSIDGHRHKNAFGAAEIESVLKWDAGVLIIESTTRGPDGMMANIVDRYSLSTDGRTLSIDRNISVDGESMQQRQVLGRA